VPTKKTSCEIVHQGIAGPAPDQILDAIRAEYWLSASAPQADPHAASKGVGRPDAPIEPKSSTQVKP
jgi:hypothetical protein